MAVWVSVAARRSLTPNALAVMKRGFAPLHENWSGAGGGRTLREPSALKVEEPWCREPVRERDLSTC